MTMRAPTAELRHSTDTATLTGGALTALHK